MNVDLDTGKKMKKIVRTIWVGALSGMALLTACCGQKGLSRQERKQLLKERTNIQEILKAREHECVYGSPEVMDRYQAEYYRLQNKLDSINAKLGQEVDLEKSARRVKLQEQIASLRAVLMERESSCVYGSPEVIEEYGRETNRLRGEVEKLEKELREL